MNRTFSIALLIFLNTYFSYSQDLKESSVLKTEDKQIINFKERITPGDGDIHFENKEDQKKFKVKWNDVDWLISYGQFYKRKTIDEKGKTALMELILINEKYQLFKMNKSNTMWLYIYNKTGAIIDGPVKYVYSIDKKRETNHFDVMETLKKYFNSCNDGFIIKRMKVNYDNKADILQGISADECEGKSYLDTIFQ